MGKKVRKNKNSVPINRSQSCHNNFRHNVHLLQVREALWHFQLAQSSIFYPWLQSMIPTALDIDGRQVETNLTGKRLEKVIPRFVLRKKGVLLHSRRCCWIMQSLSKHRKRRNSRVGGKSSCVFLNFQRKVLILQCGWERFDGGSSWGHRPIDSGAWLVEGPAVINFFTLSLIFIRNFSSRLILFWFV